jgi:hypothetical protein
MPVSRLAVLPAVFAYFSVNSAVSLFHINSTGVFLLVAGSVMGIVLGAYQVRNRNIQADKINKLIRVPGDFSMLLLILAIFFIEFYIHYAVDAHWAISESDIFRLGCVMLSGIILGISAGRNGLYYYKYVQSESVMLADSV